jgi:hypothetical protein
MVNQFGEIITDDALKQIEERRNRKAELLADMRAQRTEQALDRHSHVGTELGRAVPNGGLHHQMRKALADLSNMLMIEEYPHGAALVASLVRGLDRASHELFGGQPIDQSDISHIAEAIGPKVAPEPEATYPTDTGDISQPPADRVEKRAPLTAEDAVEPLAVFEDDDPDDDVPFDEPAASPEPQETPARKAGRQRRAAKAAQRSNDASEGA